MADPDEKPEWWARNDALRSALGLPSYDPPRFSDGTYVHDVVPRYERRFDVELRFVGPNVHYRDDWELRVDGEPVTSVGRYRDSSGNTVFEITPEQVERILEDALSR